MLQIIRKYLNTDEELNLLNTFQKSLTYDEILVSDHIEYKDNDYNLSFGLTDIDGWNVVKIETKLNSSEMEYRVVYVVRPLRYQDQVINVNTNTICMTKSQLLIMTRDMALYRRGKSPLDKMQEIITCLGGDVLIDDQDPDILMMYVMSLINSYEFGV